MYVDGSSGQDGSGALIAPDKQEWQVGLTLGFPATNNAAEYEALIAGLELARALGVRKLLVYTDSQLVAKQVNGEYQVKEPILAKYHKIVMDLLKCFEYSSLTEIPRAENTVADSLSRIAGFFEMPGTFGESKI